jgi:hypothetical protein
VSDSGSVADAQFAVSRRNAWIGIALLAVAASITGVLNGFALDDVLVILRNPRLHSLARAWRVFAETYWPVAQGASLYRPLSSLGFSVQWAIGGGSPVPFHVFSILLYAFACVAFYELAIPLVPPAAALAAAAIFAVHPLHVEAVANVVGQAEVWTALVIFVTVAWYIRARRRGPLRPSQIGGFALAYLVACGFKEHGIILPALLLVAEFTVTEPGRSRWARLRSLVPLMLTLAMTGAMFIVLRTAIIGGVKGAGLNELLRGQPFDTRFFTMLRVIVEWVRLFFWPANLSADYSPHRITIATTFDSGMLPGVLVILGVTAIAVAVRQSKPAITFGILWAALALLIPSNLLVVTGFVLAERTLFLASAGVALCIGVVALDAWQAMAGRGPVITRAAVGVFCLILLAGLARSASRGPVWRDDDSLIRQTLEDAPSSYRAHWMMSFRLTELNRTSEALDEMDLAVMLGQRDDVMLLAYAGDLFSVAGRCPRALSLYRRALPLAAWNIQLRVNTSMCLLNIGKITEARSIALGAYPADVNDPRLRNVVALSDSLLRAHGTSAAGR